MPAITIVALQDPIAIVHIPIIHADTQSTRLYWTLEHAGEGSSEFFNITSNCLEIAIFASVDLVNAHWIDSSLDNGIMISQSTWRAFEIFSGDQDENGNYDSPHLRHVSAPLAKAGITILYQSSYFTDFLLVKEADFDKASAIFAGHGWHVDGGDYTTLPSRRRSQLLSPTSPSLDHTPSPSIPSANVLDQTVASPPEITVLASPLACIGFSRLAEQSTFEKIRQLIVWPRRAEINWKRRSLTLYSDLLTPLSSLPPTPRTGKFEDSDMTQSAAAGHGFHDQAQRQTRPFLSYTRTTDGSSLISSVQVLRDMFGSHTEGEVLELDDQVYYGNGDLFDSGSEVSARSEAESEASDGEQDVGGRLPDRSRPISFPLTPDESPNLETDIGNDAVRQWGRPDGESDTDNVEETKVRPRRSAGNRVSWVDSSIVAGTSSILSANTAAGDDRATPASDSNVKRRGRKRCLQLDLTGVADADDVQDQGVYHMDKSGLVTLFSNLLNAANIRMLYSSTFHTANILVDATDVKRAKQLLGGGDPIRR
ncbi:hypothetical protein BD324DRAFT_650742 [Kockovaella imperatae]|uniref:CASTOR ACT domain-containing protein n=1 Tax=Kockovaella imperatae TaxID=4999 RepID=A0A1Y1UGD7_9TREE|nr:hypothetical protein BD324DRAFT_650742 [Kockovaella imperatae]ORX37131.1 hypothetical protein BD324DRAFT_650742 [Kockovaella imperatae]